MEKKWRKPGLDGAEKKDTNGNMAEQLNSQDFPMLGPDWKRTSEPAYYNCLGFAMGEKRSWWPGEYPGWSDDYWPTGAPNEETAEAFAIAFATVGFVRCDSSSIDPGFEKIALYGISGIIKHAARQEEDGMWRSKLSLNDEDIEHNITGIEGPCFGRIVAIFKRRRKVR
jgi:hypothetical protein